MSAPKLYRAHPEIDEYLKKGEIHSAVEAIDKLSQGEKKEQLLKVFAKLKSYKPTSKWQDWLQIRFLVLVGKFIELGELDLARQVVDQMSDSGERKSAASQLLEQAVADRMEAVRGVHTFSED